MSFWVFEVKQTPAYFVGYYSITKYKFTIARVKIWQRSVPRDFDIHELSR